MENAFDQTALPQLADTITVDRIEVWACRSPLKRPVETSFGAMADRPAVFVRVEDRDGAFGFGEIWSNFPACGAEHRARLLVDDLAPLVLGQTIRHPSEVFQRLSAAMRIRVLQTGEPGPYAQAIAGLDTALCDLFARRAHLPLKRLLNAGASETVPAYASGIHISQADTLIAQTRASGHRAFKVKVGFALGEDIARIRALAGQIWTGERLFADANQAWDLAEAVRFTASVKETGLGWIEEPLAADTLLSEWRKLAAVSAIPLAAGENLAGVVAFGAAIESRAFGVLQPDLAKWGGFTGCFPVAKQILTAGRTYCPHYLGGGIGLLASAHLLAAVGGDGLLEVDVNPNPLRDEVWMPRCTDGRIAVGNAPGLGVDRLPDSVRPLVTLHREITVDRSVH